MFNQTLESITELSVISYLLNYVYQEDIGWSEIATIPISRTVEGKIKSSIETHIKEKKSKEIVITHPPGAGATTIIRKVLYDLRLQYPCVIVHKTISVSSLVTQVHTIYSLSNPRPVIVVLDNVHIFENSVIVANI